MASSTSNTSTASNKPSSSKSFKSNNGNGSYVPRWKNRGATQQQQQQEPQPVQGKQEAETHSSRVKVIISKMNSFMRNKIDR
jgi:hypothetical protein